MRALVEHRFVLSLAVSAIVGTLGVQAYPFSATHPLLGLVQVERPTVYAGFSYTYAAMWFSTPFFLSSIVLSLVYIFVAHRDRTPTHLPLPPYPPPARRQDLFVVLGEQHHPTRAGRASAPTWLVVPERGLYTGMLIVGAIGSGKTTACMYPDVEQLAYQAGHGARKVAGLVLEVKGDFCLQVRDILQRQGRADDYVEVGLDSPYRYNPLHNDLDAYALAYGIVTLMTNLFGRGKEPFWQQASTNLVKFVILLHQVLDDYVTLFQVYENVINMDKLRARIAEGERAFSVPNHRLVVDKQHFVSTSVLNPWTWAPDEAGHTAWTAWSAELEEVVQAAQIPYQVGTVTPAVLALVRETIDRRGNILISGGTSTGKTTLLNALAACLPDDDRVVLIEDTAELQIDRANLVRFEARREHAHLPAVTIRELLRATLRHRPDRIILGEVRGGEAYDLLQALNTGHAGSLSTIHANSADQALARFSSCVVQRDLPYQAVRHQIADAIDMVLHLGRHSGARVTEDVIRVARDDASRDHYDTISLFRRGRPADIWKAQPSPADRADRTVSPDHHP